MGARVPVAKLLVLPLTWVAMASLWLRPLQAPVYARLQHFRNTADLSGAVDPAIARRRAERVVASEGLLPLPALDLPRLWVVGLLLAGATAFFRAHRRARGRARPLLLGISGMLLLGGVHVWTDLLDLWDQLLASGSLGQGLDGGRVRGGGWLADTKPALGVLACLGLAGLVDRWCGDRLAATCIAAVGLVVAQMWFFSVSGDLRGPAASLPIVAAPVAVFRAGFEALWPALAGTGTLLFDDVVLRGAMIELLVFTNLAAMLFLLAGMLLAAED